MPTRRRPTRAQVAQDGSTYTCLLQNDVNLTSPPLSNTCQDPGHGIAASHFANDVFDIDDFIAPTDKTCPAPGVSAPNGVLKDSAGALPGGCTRDLVHRFYQEQYQIDGGKQDRYTTGSDAVGLTQGRVRDPAAADLPLPAQQGRSQVRHRRPASSRARSVARSSTTSG